MPALTLSELYIYPIKSGAGIAVSEAQITARGLQYDRRWMVVDAQGKFMSQRRFPQMALIGVAIAHQLTITAPGMPDLLLPLTAESDSPIEVDVWGDRCEAIALSPDVRTWFTQFLGVDCQLVYMPDSSHRPTAHGKLGVDRLVSFADAYPYLLLSEASLGELNHKLAEKGQAAVTMKRFRPNFVVSGVAVPHAEDSWTQVRIGEVIFDLPKLCDRCSIPNVNPHTGERTKEPTATLSTYRYWDKGIWYGINGVERDVKSGVEQAALDAPRKVLHVGDTVEVLGKKVA